uniref:Uncharacterized protein n=1 Tax=Anguilla anguilla TaxID=7936 RepID=A0A0E9W7F9_ANGAN
MSWRDEMTFPWTGKSSHSGRTVQHLKISTHLYSDPSRS